MISPYKFKWNSLSSLNFDVLTYLSFDSDNGAAETGLGREAIISETYNGSMRRAHMYKWDESFVFQLTLIKKDFGDFSSEENRKILKWLTSRQNAGFLDIYKDDSEVIEFSALGNFVNIASYKLVNGRIVGYIIDWESLAPYAFSDLHTIEKTISSATDNKIMINVDTDDSQPIYPRITIQENGAVVQIPAGTTFSVYSDMVPNTVYYNGTNYYWKSDESALVTGDTEPTYDWPKIQIDTAYSDADEIKEETVYYYTSDQKYRWIDPYTFKSSTSNPHLATTSVRIINKHTDLFGNPKIYSSTIVKNNRADETIVLDGANQIISSSSTKRIFGDDFVNWAWLPLYDGKNELTIEGNCDVEISYREVRKIGEY
jgi:hypothetical protein